MPSSVPNAQIKALRMVPRFQKPAVNSVEFLLKAHSLIVHIFHINGVTGPSPAATFKQPSKASSFRELLISPISAWNVGKQHQNSNHAGSCPLSAYKNGAPVLGSSVSVFQLFTCRLAGAGCSSSAGRCARHTV